MNAERRPSKVLKFAPIKLLVIESRSEYYRIIGCAIGIGLSHVLIGATIMVTFMYSLQTGDTHAILCTLGYQFFSSQAILSLSYVNGWSSHLRLNHRKSAHIILQICAMICVVLGLGMLITPNTRISSSSHSIAGVFAVCCTLLCILSGPLGLHERNNIKLVHMACGLPTYFISSACVCLGFHTSKFTLWANTVIVCLVTVFVIFYTLCICVVTIIHGVFFTK